MMRVLPRHFPIMLLVLVLVQRFACLVAAQGDTSVRVVVWDGHNRPVAGLTLTLLTEDQQSRSLQTDATGKGTTSGLEGSFFRITAASYADGRPVPVDATTLDEGLRLGLLPNQQRTVLLRLDDDLLFVDPQLVFSGTDSPDTAAVEEARSAAVIATAVSLTADSGAPTGSGTVTPSDAAIDDETVDAAPRTEQGWSRWQVGLVMVLVVLIPVVLVAIRTLLAARRQAGRPR